MACAAQTFDTLYAFTAITTSHTPTSTPNERERARESLSFDYCFMPTDTEAY
jgi:hypothetical protein